MELEIERLRRVCAYIHTVYSDPIDRDEVAEIALRKSRAFSRFFRMHTGKTFRDFVAEVRIGHACRMLLGAEANVTEIALSCGFADGTTFDRSFRRIKMMSPTQFRRQMRLVTR